MSRQRHAGSPSTHNVVIIRHSRLAHILQLPIKKNSNLLNIPFCEKCTLCAQINPFFPKILQLCNLFSRAAALFFPLFPSVFHKSPLHGHSSFPLVFAIFCILFCETLFCPCLVDGSWGRFHPRGTGPLQSNPFPREPVVILPRLWYTIG